MASRQEPADSLDFSPTPPFATRALLERVLPALNISRASLTSVHEPGCGEGHMAEVLREYFPAVEATDSTATVMASVQDFLADDFDITADWIITNPPFKEKAEQFALKAIELAHVGVAIFAACNGWRQSADMSVCSVTIRRRKSRSSASGSTSAWADGTPTAERRRHISGLFGSRGDRRVLRSGYRQAVARR